MSAQDRVDAARALGRVVRAGAWSNIVSREASDPRTAQYLVYGTLRRLNQIDARLTDCSSRPLDRISKDLLDLLRVVGFELADEPERATAVVVDTGVRAASLLEPRFRGFANAVLRRMAEKGPLPEPASASDRGIPDWLDRVVADELGREETTALWKASDRGAPVGLRSTTPIEGAQPVAGIADAWIWSNGAPPANARVQDPSSVAVGNSLGVEPGMLVLDMAAAPGGKTSHLLDLGARVVAADSHRRRVKTGAGRVPGASWVVADGTRPPFRPATFDRVLVDAPCTGLGTLRRRPEVRYNVTPEGMNRLAAIQRDMLGVALDLVRPGGRLVYSVCTVTPAETIEVVGGLGGRAPALLPGRPWGDGWLLSPDLGPTDGMFVCIFER